MQAPCINTLCHCLLSRHWHRIGEGLFADGDPPHADATLANNAFISGLATVTARAMAFVIASCFPGVARHAGVKLVRGPRLRRPRSKAGGGKLILRALVQLIFRIIVAITFAPALALALASRLSLLLEFRTSVPSQRNKTRCTCRDLLSRSPSGFLRERLAHHPVRRGCPICAFSR